MPFNVITAVNTINTTNSGIHYIFALCLQNKKINLKRLTTKCRLIYLHGNGGVHPEVSFTAVQLENVIQSAFMSAGSTSNSTVEKKKSEKSGPLSTHLN